MDGLVFLHNLAGQALAQANAEIAQLRDQVAALEAELDAVRRAHTGPQQ